MKRKKFTPTKAKLPDNEKIIGGDAHPSLFAKRDVNATEREFKQWQDKNSPK
ncbi:MAG: hypothetical protein U0X91_03530 [Spirosomataceae bacterium]